MSGRPFIYVNMATSVDGKITSVHHEVPTFTSRLDRLHMDRLRASADAVLVGAATVRVDDPPMHIRDPEMQALRRSLGKPAALWHVVVSRRCDLDPTYKFFTTAHHARRLVVTTEAAPTDKLEALRRTSEVWQLGATDVDVPALVERLHEAGIERLLVEGGGEVLWHFAAHDLVDEINLTLAPTLIGGRGAPTPLAGVGWPLAERRRLALADLRREGDELYLRYTVERGAATKG
jgi:riboflavin-specific deaminase-like protein